MSPQKTQLAQLLPISSSDSENLDQSHGRYPNMDSDLLADVRMQLKHNLKTSRVTIWKGRVVPVCAICKGGITGGMEMHEALFTRGNVRGNKDLLVKIMVRENCLLLHPGDCHKRAHTKLGRLICLEYLERVEGAKAIKDFLVMMNELMVTELGSERLSEGE